MIQATSAFATASPPIAAIVHGERGSVDALLADFAFSLARSGVRVRGLVQQSQGGSKAGTQLVDLLTGDRYPLFQNLGSASTACSIDPGSIATASTVLRQALTAQPDLVVVNRFGGLEANGGGFAAEMLALMADGVPLVTVVADEYQLDWRFFTGRAGVELPPREEALRAWFAALPAKGRREAQEERPA